jgi:hypothetical protein
MKTTSKAYFHPRGRAVVIVSNTPIIGCDEQLSRKVNFELGIGYFDEKPLYSLEISRSSSWIM